MKAGILISLASVALGHPSGSAEDASIAWSGYANLDFYSQHAAAAYCNADKKHWQKVQCDGNCPTVEANGAFVTDSFVGSWTGIGGYVAVDQARNEIVLAVRGTSNVRNLLTNISFSWRACDHLVAGYRVHAGFGFVVGHSLGGAVATLAAADLYTYGTPRVGNEAFVNFVSSQPGGRQWRVTHRDDLVPRLPPIFLGFRHVSPEYWLAGDTLDSIRLCHGIENIDCNANSDGFGLNAHLHYLRPVGRAVEALGRRPVQPRSGGPYDDFKQRLGEWARMDHEFVKYANYYHCETVS